jgi:hypothetical protein
LRREILDAQRLVRDAHFLLRRVSSSR